MAKNQNSSVSGISSAEESSPAEEQRRLERWQAYYHPGLENTQINEYCSDPSFRIATAKRNDTLSPSSVSNNPIVNRYIPKNATTVSSSNTTIAQAPMVNIIEDNFTISAGTNLIAGESVSKGPTLPELPSSDLKKDIKKTNALGARIAEAIQRNEILLNGICSILIRSIENQNELIIKLTKEDEANLENLLIELSKREKTENFKLLLNIVSAASAITIGALLLAPETLAVAAAAGTTYSAVCGWTLILSGVADLMINELLPTVGGYEKIASLFSNDPTNTQHYADNIQTASSISNSILKIATYIVSAPIIGAVFSWSHGLNIFNTGMELASSGINAKNSYHDYNYKNVEADKIRIDGNMKTEQFRLEQSYEGLKSVTEIEETVGKLSREIFEILVQMAATATQKRR